MDITSRKIRVLELTEEMMYRAAGGRRRRGLFGTHCLALRESFHVIAKDGTDFCYTRWFCRDCENDYFTVERSCSGIKEEITLSEFRRARSMAEDPDSAATEVTTA